MEVGCALDIPGDWRTLPVMTVREFAERVLFGSSLDEKLAPPPAGVVDTEPGRAIATPVAPGRPMELMLRDDGVRADFPGTVGIEDDVHRGKLLHFFANHELLATELMALVLLKFPDAPAEFREGILRTLKEEQMHTKLYLKRMKACGVEFGDLPVNGFFWNAVSSMPTPLDYVTRLSLTFEQANLDYARGYAQVFAASGDEETAAILDRIYRDEIGHVHYGLEWFRKWKEEELTDWEAYRSRLEIPLSPARAKGGFEFNEEGRREAGLEEDFIRELKVYSQSKGRTPNVYWFNPGAEESLVPEWNGVVLSAARQVANDLALLPAFLARNEDVVIVPEVPAITHLGHLLEAGIAMPELAAIESVEEVAHRKLHELRPWARTPDAARVGSRFKQALPMTEPELFSKSYHAELLAGLVEKSNSALLCRRSEVGVTAKSVHQVESWLHESEFGRCVIKAPFSTAGRERLHRAGRGPLTLEESGWIVRMIADQGAVVVEPWLERLVDFSIQYDFSAERGLRRRGLVVLENTPQGQFRRATVAGRFTDFLDEGTRRALFEGVSKRGAILEFIEDELEPSLAEALEEHHYAGPLGVDAFLYRDEREQVRFKPVVEINPRYTMGRVAIELGRFLPPNVNATLVIGKAEEEREDAVRLTPISENTRFAAYLSPVPAQVGE